MKRFLQKIKALKDDVYILYLAFKHPETPAQVKIIIGFTVAYILSPIDLIPDSIPLLGYLDELTLVPVFLTVASRLVPPRILEACHERARRNPLSKKIRLWTGAVIVLFLCLILAVYTVRWYWQSQP